MKKITSEQVKKGVKVLGKVISALSILFIVYAIWKLGFDFDSIENVGSFLIVAAIGVLLKAATVFISGYTWAGWLGFLAGKKADTRAAVLVYGKANIGKYLPGNVMHYVERNLFASNMGISQKKLAFSSILEVLTLISAAFLIAICSLGKQLFYVLGQLDPAKLRLVALAVLLLIVACIALLLVLRRKLIPILKEYSIREFLLTLVKSLIQYAVVLVTLGIIMVLLYRYMGGEITWAKAAVIVSAYVVAWVLGFVIPGASGGIGVRELVITLLLSDVVGADLILTLSVIHRLITIVGDFLVYLMVILLGRKGMAGKQGEGTVKNRESEDVK